LCPLILGISAPFADDNTSLNRMGKLLRRCEPSFLENDILFCKEIKALKRNTASAI
jgi:hypothetical protein